MINYDSLNKADECRIAKGNLTPQQLKHSVASDRPALIRNAFGDSVEQSSSPKFTTTFHLPDAQVYCCRFESLIS